MLLACTRAPPCPADMLLIEGGTFELGEVSPGKGHEGLVITRRTMVIEDYCIATHPFPGEGLDWPSDGLSLSQLQTWEPLVNERGRRACTVEELVRAAAGPMNQPRSSTREDCESKDHQPGPIGSHPACRTAEGLVDFGVRSSWAHLASLDAEFPRYERWASWGHTWRDDTFYPTTNFAIHSHDPAETSYLDDGWRSCASPRRDKGRWAEFSQAFPGSFAALLD